MGRRSSTTAAKATAARPNRPWAVRFTDQGNGMINRDGVRLSR
jgi:hypothetical protein